MFGLSAGAPIFVGSDIDRDVVRPGGSVRLVAGADFGYFVPEFTFGYLGFPIKPVGAERKPIHRIHLGFGGRLQVPNNSIVLPYLSAEFAAQWWKVEVCPFSACRTSHNFRFAPGVTLGLGMAIGISRSVAVDIGLRYSVSFVGDDVFPDTRHWLEPTIGMRFWI